MRRPAGMTQSIHPIADLLSSHLTLRIRELHSVKAGGRLVAFERQAGPDLIVPAKGLDNLSQTHRVWSG